MLSSHTTNKEAMKQNILYPIVYSIILMLNSYTISNYLSRFIYRYDNIIHSSYEVVSLFLIKHTVPIECINIKMVLYETGICLNIKFQYNKGYISL